MSGPDLRDVGIERRLGKGYAELPAVRRYFDTALGKHVVRVVAGEHYFTSDRNEVIITVLGSCIAACIRDPVAEVGGMNHFMLPDRQSSHWGADAYSAMRYGNVAMERLINDLLKNGAERGRLEVKVFGGANVIRSRNAIGTQNAAFVRDYLYSEGFAMAAEDLEGGRPRRIHYDPASGEVVRFWLNRTDDLAIMNAEAEYQKSLKPQDMAGSVELFE